MKRLQKVVALVMLIVVIPLASFANEITEEDTSIVRNPDRGFYKLIQVELQQGDEDYTRFEKQIISVENEYPDISIISFQLNLKNYTQKTEINKIKINDIDKYSGTNNPHDRFACVHFFSWCLSFIMTLVILWSHICLSCNIS